MDINICSIIPGEVSAGSTTTLTVGVTEQAPEEGTVVNLSWHFNGSRDTLESALLSLRVPKYGFTAEATLQTRAVPNGSTRITVIATVPGGQGTRTGILLLR